MTEPDEPSSRGANAALTFAGIVLAPLLLIALATATEGSLMLVAAGAFVVGSIVLIARGGAGRALGIGVLIGISLLLLGVGAIFAACASQT